MWCECTRMYMETYALLSVSHCTLLSLSLSLIHTHTHTRSALIRGPDVRRHKDKVAAAVEALEGMQQSR